ncbi:MAG: hypothetical protein NTX03_02980, partial [Bacteroidetes bacterium]|nr:hypothetical protein [Bacteroidota bacterium]
MMHKKIILTAILALGFLANGFSQGVDSVKKDVTNTPWYFTIGLDFKVRSIYGNFYDSYSGEGYFNQHYYWIQNASTNKKFLEGNKSYFPKLDFMISKWRNCRFGMSYNTGIIRVNPSSDNEVDYLYLAINGIAEYQYNFNKVTPYEGGFIYTSLAAGPYRSSENLEGPGTEFFAQLRLGGGYEYKGFMAKAFI